MTRKISISTYFSKIALPVLFQYQRDKNYQLRGKTGNPNAVSGTWTQPLPLSRYCRIPFRCTTEPFDVSFIETR